MDNYKEYVKRLEYFNTNNSTFVDCMQYMYTDFADIADEKRTNSIAADDFLNKVKKSKNSFKKHLNLVKIASEKYKNSNLLLCNLLNELKVMGFTDIKESYNHKEVFNNQLKIKAVFEVIDNEYHLLTDNGEKVQLQYALKNIGDVFLQVMSEDMFKTYKRV